MAWRAIQTPGVNLPCIVYHLGAHCTDEERLVHAS